MDSSGEITTEYVGKILLIIAFAVVIILLVWKVKVSVEENQGSFSDFTCFASNLLKHNVMHSFPSACGEGRIGVVYTVKDEKDESVEKKVADLMDKCWWMYGSGEWDLGAKADDESMTLFKNIAVGELPLDYTYVCYAFSLEKEMTIDELYDFMKTHKRNSDRDTSVEDPDSYWNYIQKNSMGEGIGIDREIGYILKKNKVYYIIFFDERHYESVKGAFTFNDKILISDKADFGDSILYELGEDIKLDNLLKKIEDFMATEVI